MKARRRKMEESKYNEMYGRIMTKETLEYLKGKMKKRCRSILARFRCGNEKRDKQHWKEKEQKMCRMCEEEKKPLGT